LFKKRKKEREKRGRVRKKKQRENKEDKCPNIERFFSNPSSQQGSSKFKRGIKFLQGAKEELDVHHYSSTPLFPLTSYIHHHFHNISTQPIFRITHMHILI
jgi:hypothetical protein